MRDVKKGQQRKTFIMHSKFSVPKALDVHVETWPAVDSVSIIVTV